MSHSASDGIGNRLYLLIPLALSFSPSLSLALSHSTPPLIHLLSTLLNTSPNPIVLSHRLPAFSFSQPQQSFCHLFFPRLPTSFLLLSCFFFFYIKPPPPLPSPYSPRGLGDCTYSDYRYYYYSHCQYICGILQHIKHSDKSKELHTLHRCPALKVTHYIRLKSSFCFS